MNKTNPIAAFIALLLFTFLLLSSVLPARADDQTGAAPAGANVTFVVTSDGNPAPTFEWSKDGVAIPGATTATYVIPSFASDQAGAYTVKATNSLGSATSGKYTLILGTAPTTPEIKVSVQVTVTVTTPAPKP